MILYALARAESPFRLVTSHLYIINKDDIIVTADSDAFIMTDEILKPLDTVSLILALVTFNSD